MSGSKSSSSTPTTSTLSSQCSQTGLDAFEPLPETQIANTSGIDINVDIRGTYSYVYNDNYF